MASRSLAYLVGPALALAAAGCEQAPIDATASVDEPATAAPPGAPAAAATTAAAEGPLAKADRRIAALEAEVTELRALLKKFSVDEAGNVTLAADLRVNGAVGINTAPVPRQALTAVGDTIGVKASAQTAVVARGALVGVDTDGPGNGLLATSTNLAVAASGANYSFYGFTGWLHNDYGLRSPLRPADTIQNADPESP